MQQVCCKDVLKVYVVLMTSVHVVLQSVERMEKLENIASTVLEELTDSCADCGITK